MSETPKPILKVASSNQTAEFYDSLMEGKKQRGILGKDTRYNPQRILQKFSTQKYFVDVVKPLLKPTDKVLDFGCGPGSFLAATAPLCATVTGVDISRNFVNTTQETIKALSIPNALAVHIQPDVLPFADESFDVVLMMDVVHHLENVSVSLTEVLRVLKPGARVLIFEPNKLNPLIYLVHLFDRNEWGLLRLGTPSIYRKLLKPFVDIKTIDFNGIVIGPDSKIYDYISQTINVPALKPLLGWLNPKMFIVATKR